MHISSIQASLIGKIIDKKLLYRRQEFLFKIYVQAEDIPCIQGGSLTCTYILIIGSYGKGNTFFLFHFFQLGFKKKDMNVFSFHKLVCYLNIKPPTHLQKQLQNFRKMLPCEGN